MNDDWTQGGHGGMDVGDVADGDDEAGWVEYGPLDVRDKMRDASAVMRAVNTAVVDAKGVPKDFLHQWTLTWIAWNRFYDRFDGLPGTVGQFRDTTYKRADLYIRTAEAFARGLKSKTWLKAPVKPPVPKNPGEVAVQPSGKTPTTASTKDGGDVWPLWKWLLVGGVLAGGGVAAYKLWPKEKGHEQISDAEALAYLQSKGGP